MSGSIKGLYDTLGAIFLGATITMSLWGIATLQTYYYYNRYLKDNQWIKFLVFSVWALDTVHQALILDSGYQFLVTGYSNPQFMEKSGHILAFPIIPGFIVTGIVHLFLLFRIWILSKKNLKLATICATLIILETICIIVELTKTFPVKQYADIESSAWLIKLYFSVMASTDTSIALTLIILLHRSRTGFEKSDNIIKRLIIFTVNTGAIPSLITILSIVMIETHIDNLIWYYLYLLTSKVYTNTFLATLNARENSVETLNSPVPKSVSGIRKATNIDMSMAICVDTTTSHRTDNISLEESKPEVPGSKITSVDLV